MSRSIVVKSFAELAEMLGYEELPELADVEIEATPVVPETPQDTSIDLASLLSELEAASTTLASVARRDQEARTLAMQDLEAYDAIVGERGEAEKARELARQVRDEAERLAESAFADEAGAAASRVAAMAVRAEAAATEIIEQRRQQADRLAAQLDLERLLAARRRQQEADKAKAAEAERARRLADALGEAQQALAAGHVQEAKAVLGPLAKDNPDNAEVASFMEIIARRELTVKVDMAERALWSVRREHRRDSATAVAMLETLDVDGLPELLARQVFGAWADHCAHVCRQRSLMDPLRYAPNPGRGAVLARETPEGPYIVVSALGMQGAWVSGNVVDSRLVSQARPLR